MTEEEEDSNAPDKIIFRQDPNEFECAFKKNFIDEIEIDDRYSYENTFLNLDEEIQFIFGGNDSLLKRCENNINDFNNKNINIIQDKNLEKNLQILSILGYWINLKIILILSHLMIILYYLMN